MKQHYVMPVGVDDFRRVREEYYYVDKTEFIKKLLDGHAQATLITRPRRFGKTLAMSMLYYFFTNKDAEANRVLFEGSKIEAAGERYMAEQGSRPVVFLSLKDIKQSCMENMVEMLGAAMQYVYDSFCYLQEGEILSGQEKQYFRRVLEGKASNVDLQLSLKNLTEFLARFYGKPTLVLIDEYDAPIQYAWDYGYYDEAIVFMRNYLSSVLKSNPHLDFAVLTGVLRVAKESIFSSLNNLKVSSVASGSFADAMGFSDEEIRKIAADFGVPDKYEEIKTWYDGYNFSGQSIYNPWSVISYFDNECKPRAYWVNTSGNSILREMLAHATSSQTMALTDLLHGRKIFATLDEGVIYDGIYKNSNALFSMLLTTGYLTMVDYPDYAEGETRSTMRIPNREISYLFKGEIMAYLENNASDNTLLHNLTDSLLAGRAADFAEAMSNYLRLLASFYDTAARESFYHGLVLGLLATLMPRFEVVSNRESGYGRFDIAIFPGPKQSVGALLEFKVAESEGDMPERAKEALAQIKENKYLSEFQQRGVKEVWQYGIAFCGKKCHIEVGACKSW